MLGLLKKSPKAVSVVLLALALSGCAAQQGGVTFPDGGRGLVTPYTITLRYFTTGEARTLIDTMAHEFPGYRSHTLISSDSATRKYAYVSSARAHKLEEWLTILLSDMNINPDTGVHINIKGAKITLEKLHPTWGWIPKSDRGLPVHRDVSGSRPAV